MKGGGAIRSGGGGGGGLMRTRLRLPVVLLSCSLFFLAGFLGSLLFTQVTGPARLVDSFRCARGLLIRRLFRGRIRRGRRTRNGRCGGSG